MNLFVGIRHFLRLVVFMLRCDGSGFLKCDLSRTQKISKDRSADSKEVPGSHFSISLAGHNRV
jgi:hypothetical protein